MPSIVNNAQMSVSMTVDWAVAGFCKRLRHWHRGLAGSMLGASHT